MATQYISDPSDKSNVSLPPLKEEWKNTPLVYFWRGTVSPGIPVAKIGSSQNLITRRAEMFRTYFDIRKNEKRHSLTRMDDTPLDVIQCNTTLESKYLEASIHFCFERIGIKQVPLLKDWFFVPTIFFDKSLLEFKNLKRLLIPSAISDTISDLDTLQQLLYYKKKPLRKS